MRGEPLAAVSIGRQGVAGDRRYAIRSSTAPAALPYLTSRALEQMLLYRPFYQLSDGETGAALFVETPEHEVLSIDDPRLLALLAEQMRQPAPLSVERSPMALTDEYAVSLFALGTAAQLSQELGMLVDKRRFRANLYLDLLAPEGFAEDAFVGKQLRIGRELHLQVEQRDPRCKVITLSPDNAEPCADILRHVAAAHARCAGVYASVLEPGVVHVGDPVLLLP